MADEAAALGGDGGLRELHELQQVVEAVAILHHEAHHAAGGIVAFVLDEAGADVADDAGEVDASGADIVAGFAADAVLHEGTGLIGTVVQVGEGEAHSTDVHVTHLVAADETVHGADVGAGAAAHAAEDVLEGRILHDLGTAVVEEDDVHFLLAVGADLALVGAGDPGHIGGDGLGGGVTGQDLDAAQSVGNGGDQLFEAGAHNVHAGQGGHESEVAFVGHSADDAGFGNGEVGAGDAHVGVDVFSAQFLTGDLDHLLNVFTVLLLLGDLGEEISHLIAGQVDGGHDHVRRTFVAVLDDPFAEVGLDHAEAFSLKRRVEMDFFGGHGLGLDDGLAVGVLADAGDDAVGFSGISGEVDMDAALFSFGLELLVEFHHVLSGVVLDVGNVLDQLGNVPALEDAGAVGLVVNGELVQGLAEELVVQSLLDLTVVFLHILMFGHVLVLQQHDMEFEGTVHAEGAHAFDVSGTAGAGDHGGIGSAAAGHEVDHEGSRAFEAVDQGGLLDQHDGELSDHGAEAHFFAVGIDDAGHGVDDESVGPGDAGIETAQIAAEVGTEQLDAGAFSLGFEGGEFFVVQAGDGELADELGGDAVFAFRAVLFASNGHKHFAGALLESHVHGVLHGIGEILGLIKSGRNAGSLFSQDFNEGHRYSLAGERQSCVVKGEEPEQDGPAPAAYQLGSISA